MVLAFYIPLKAVTSHINLMLRRSSHPLRSLRCREKQFAWHIRSLATEQQHLLLFYTSFYFFYTIKLHKRHLQAYEALLLMVLVESLIYIDTNSWMIPSKCGGFELLKLWEAIVLLHKTIAFHGIQRGNASSY